MFLQLQCRLCRSHGSQHEQPPNILAHAHAQLAKPTPTLTVSQVGGLATLALLGGSHLYQDPPSTLYQVPPSILPGVLVEPLLQGRPPCFPAFPIALPAFCAGPPEPVLELEAMP